MPHDNNRSSDAQPRPMPDPHWLDRRDNAGRTHFRRRPGKLERSRETALQDWLGPDLASAEIVQHQHGAIDAGSVVTQVLAELHIGPPPLLAQLQDNWAKLVGADVARRSQPTALQGERVVIEVTDSTWLYVLERVQKPGILAKVQALTNGQIKDIRFVAGGRRPQGPG